MLNTENDAKKFTANIGKTFFEEYEGFFDRIWHVVLNLDMDKLTKEQRYRCMLAIKGKNTKPELLVRKFLFSRGFRYRLNHPWLPGYPDLVLRKYRTVIFVNGCFWHGHDGCKYYVLPKTNVEF